MSMDELSYVHGAAAVPLLGLTIGAQLDAAAVRWGERPALIVREQGVRLSYAELHASVEACAAGLLALGLDLEQLDQRLAQGVEDVFAALHRGSPQAARWALT